jgi:hypothetical protein
MNIYISGRMRGVPDFNFPDFDYAAKTLRLKGHTVFNPAEHDREVYGDTFHSETGDEKELTNGFNLAAAFARDVDVILNQVDAVVFLPGWEASAGARCEMAIAKLVGRQLLDHNLQPLYQKEEQPAVGEVRVVNATGGAKGVRLERFDLIPVEPLEELARVYGYGVSKYPTQPGDVDNWRKGYSWKLTFGAMMRHAWKFWRGESIDPESGRHHLAMSAWHCFTLMWFEKHHPQLDDRQDKPK